MEISINSDDYQDSINSAISMMSSNLEKYELFDGLNNQEILDFHYGETIYQFDCHTLGFHYKTTVKFVNDTESLILITPNFGEHSDPFTVGKIEGTDVFAIKRNLLKKKITDIRIYGGRYKKVVVKPDGADSVKSYREPYSLKLVFNNPPELPAEHEKVIRNSQPIENKLMTIGTTMEKVGNSMNNSGKNISNAGCGATLGCTIPIILLIIIIIIMFL
ncbi:MAG: hypothetical protein ABF991_03485 [Liquorilactobacillus hordei]|uniref:hypothetical protein n=1 Tax=Liquorilactobacillus hordei TaxID=468911 RepID=UPI0039EC6E50